MKTLELTNAKLMRYETLKNGSYGQPRYRLQFSNELNSIIGVNKLGARCGYTAMNFRDGRACNVAYHITKGGKTVIDDIKEA